MTTTDDNSDGTAGDDVSITVAAAQFDPVPGKMRLNISRAIELTAQAGVSGADLVVLPELCTTGYYMFDMFKDLAEPLDGPTVAVLHELARRWELHVVVGLAERASDGALYDTAALIGPGGLVGAYRKIHLWDREIGVFKPGKDPPVLDTGGPLGRVGVLVCYDLEFPETAEEVSAGGAGILVAPAAFGNLALWQSTLQKTARELGIPLVAANRIGVEGDTRFCGHSMVIDSKGEVIQEGGGSEGLVLARVQLASPEGRKRDLRLIHPEFG